MRYRYFILLTVFIIKCSLYGQQLITSNELLNKDSILLINHIEKVASETEFQFFYFPGWISKIKIEKPEDTDPIHLILTHAFENTEFDYFINRYNQVIITLDQPIIAYFQIIDSTHGVTMMSSSNELPKSRSILNKRDASLDVDWTIIGDPDDPEQSPKVNISGYVFDDHTKIPLEGAIVFVEELSGGTTTDSTGYYKLSLRQGKYNIVFQSVGLKENNIRIQLYSSGQLDVGLTELIMDMEEVVIRADRKSNINSVQMGVEALQVESIKKLPALMGEVDIVRSAIMLPGVQSVGEFSNGINVRGGGADQNLILFNGATIFNSSHLFGFSSSFNPDIVDGFELYKSSIPAQYGGRISSVLKIDMKEGQSDRWGLQGGISPLTSRLTATGPLASHTSVIVSGRTTYSDWILGQIENASFRNSRANYGDMALRIKSQLAQNNHLDISSYYSNDYFKLNGDTTYAYTNFNIAANYQHEFSEKLFGTLSASVSNYDYSVTSDARLASSFDLTFKIKQMQSKAHFSYAPSNAHQLNFGIGFTHYKLNPGNIVPGAPESSILERFIDSERGFEANLYLSDEWIISNRFSLSAGVRYTHYAYLGPQSVRLYKDDSPRVERNIIGTTEYLKGKIIEDYAGLEPRLSMRYTLNQQTSIKAAFNRNRQFLSMLFNSASVSPTSIWKLSDSYIKPQTGNQMSLGIFRNLWGDRLELSLEGYYKKIEDVVDYKAGADLLLNNHVETDLVNGEGKAYGVELLIKKTGRKLNGWMSYTYSKSLFRSRGLFPEDQINRGEWYPSNFDKPHDFSFVGNYRVSKRFSLSSNVVYSTGRPITIPVGRYNYGGGIRLQYSTRNEYRVPDYFRVDFSLNLEGNHRRNKLAHSSWSLSVYNLTGVNNVYSIYFISDGSNAKGYKLSILSQPIVTLTYNFKI